MEVKNLGLQDYRKTWDLQRRLIEERREGLIGDTLLLLEHPPVYTRGISAQTPPPATLPHPFYLIERGGDWTYHGPGQLVGYPLIRLSERGFLVRDYLRFLESTLIEGLSHIGIKGEAIKGLTGVWAQGKKIGSIGIAVKQGISYHGFSLNVCCDLKPFHSIYPCKLEPDEVSTLEILLKRPISVKEVLDIIAPIFSKALEEHPPTR